MSFEIYNVVTNKLLGSDETLNLSSIGLFLHKPIHVSRKLVKVSEMILPFLESGLLDLTSLWKSLAASSISISILYKWHCIFDILFVPYTHLPAKYETVSFTGFQCSHHT